MATGGSVIPVRMVFSSEAELQPPVKERAHMKKAACVPGAGHNRTRPTNAVDTPTEGIVWDINEESAASQSMLSKLQESTGFAKDILTRVEKDVWSGL